MKLKPMADNVLLKAHEAGMHWAADAPSRAGAVVNNLCTEYSKVPLAFLGGMEYYVLALRKQEC